MTRLRRRCASFLWTIALLGCAGAARTAETITAVRVERAGSDEPGAFCSDFRLDARAAARALAGSHRLSPEQLESYDHLPCYVRGTARMAGQPIRWELRAGGDGSIVRAGRSYPIGCPSCRRTFGAD